MASLLYSFSSTSILWLAVVPVGMYAKGQPVIVIDATHAAPALKTGFRNKTDRNDARGIADLMGVNKFRPVWAKSPAAQRDRALLTVREQLRRQSLDARNTIWSILQGEGFRPPKIASPAFKVLLELFRLARQLLRRTAELGPPVARQLKAQLGDLALRIDGVLRHRSDDALERLGVIGQADQAGSARR